MSPIVFIPSNPGGLLRLLPLVLWGVMVTTASLPLFGQNVNKKDGGLDKAGKEDLSSSSSSSSPIGINISRRTLSNFLTDKAALAPYLTSDSSPRPFRSAFVIDSPQSNFAIVWD